MAPLVWLVTGSTSGIGRALVQHIVARGDKVIASGRKVEERLGEFKSDSFALLELDITAGFEAISKAINEAWDIFGHIDVLVNNAGMNAMRAAEEADDAFISNMFAVNLFGPMHVTRAILPLLRSRGQGGKIAFTSSGAGWCSLPFLSHYSASKAALSIYAESLHKELRPLGISCTVIEPGGFPTHLGQPRADDPAAAASFGNGGAGIADYQPGFAALGGMFMEDPLAFMPGSLEKVGPAIVDVIKGEGIAKGRKWPARVIFGSDSYESITQKCGECLELYSDWKDVAYSTDRDGYDHVTSRKYLKYVSIFEDKE